MARQILENIQLQGSLDWYNFQNQIRKEVQECVKLIINEQKELRNEQFEKGVELNNLALRVDEIEHIAGIKDNPLTGAKSKFTKLENDIIQVSIELKQKISDFHFIVDSCKKDVQHLRDDFNGLKEKQEILVSFKCILIIFIHLL